MHQLAVIGNPIEHSLSPLVFELFAKQFAIELAYTKILAKDEDDFKLQIKDFFTKGGLAINITSPFKNLAYEVTTSRTVRAGFCQASNFIRYQGNDLLADTTDGIGLVTDIIKNKKVDLANKKILIIGSGFVLDSILLDLIVQNPAQISVLARNTLRLNYLYQKYSVIAFDEICAYDVILNTTPNIANNGLFGQIKNISDRALCYDLTYAQNSIFLNQMKITNQLAQCFNGLGMLVEQAKVAFNILFSQNPDSIVVMNQLSALGYVNN